MNDIENKRSQDQQSPGESKNFRIFLQNAFLARCEKNSNYSISSFARALGMDKSTLAKMLKGQRTIGKESIQKISIKLGLNPNQVLEFQQASPRKNARTRPMTDEAANSYQQLSLDTFQVISDWYHYAILELMRLKHAENDPVWIARTLGITSVEVQIAIERLVRLEMISISACGAWRDMTGGHSTTLSNRFTAAAFRKMQKQLLEKALIALEEVPFEKRSQTSTTMAVNSNQIPKAKLLIADFQRKMNALLNNEDGRTLNDVYTLSISLFPLTHNQFQKNPGEKNEIHET